jgi:hypothetical protein
VARPRAAVEYSAGGPFGDVDAIFHPLVLGHLWVGGPALGPLRMNRTGGGYRAEEPDFGVPRPSSSPDRRVNPKTRMARPAQHAGERRTSPGSRSTSSPALDRTTGASSSSNSSTSLPRASELSATQSGAATDDPRPRATTQPICPNSTKEPPSAGGPMRRTTTSIALCLAESRQRDSAHGENTGSSPVGVTTVKRKSRQFCAFPPCSQNETHIAPHTFSQLLRSVLGQPGRPRSV